jgi:hypothetical protein
VNFRINMLVIAFAVVASVGLSPSLVMNQSASAASHSCEIPGKPSDWIQGCKDGWYDHDHCMPYSPVVGHYAEGYKVGWPKGSCHK